MFTFYLDLFHNIYRETKLYLFGFFVIFDWQLMNNEVWMHHKIK